MELLQDPLTAEVVNLQLQVREARPTDRPRKRKANAESSPLFCLFYLCFLVLRRVCDTPRLDEL